MKTRLLALIIFGIGFAFVEAAAVFYLRTIFHYSEGYLQGNYKVLLNTGIVTFIWPDAPIFNNIQITSLEIQREVATIVMLFVVAFLSSSKWKQRLGAFLIMFSFWDIFYYIFLKYLTGWPKSFLDIDLYFMLPVPWIGPVITPIIIFTILGSLGVILYLRKN